MPPKRRKFESTFPAARIKKIMQLDDDVGRVASSVPILISRAVEIFLQALLSRTADYASSRNAKTLTVLHLKHCIEQEKQWDFLKDLTAKISEVGKQVEGEDSSAPRRGRKRRNSQSKAPSGKRKHVEGEENASEKSGDEGEGEGVERPQPASSQISTSSVPLMQPTTSIPVSVLVTPATVGAPHLTSTSTLPPLSQQQPSTFASIPAASSSSQAQNSSGSEGPSLAIFSAGLQRTVSSEEEEDYDA